MTNYLFAQVLANADGDFRILSLPKPPLFSTTVSQLQESHARENLWQGLPNDKVNA